MPNRKTPSDSSFLSQTSRRDFLKMAGGAALTLVIASVVSSPVSVSAASETASKAAGKRSLAAGPPVAEVPIIWIQAGSCSGCSVSFLNTMNPKVQNIVLDELVPGVHVTLQFHQTLMAGQGDIAMEAMYRAEDLYAGKFILVAEGSFSTKDDGIYCRLGEKDGQEVTALEHLLRLSRKAMAVVAIGACATFGGIPAAKPNPTGCKGVREILRENDINTPVINTPGCPVHPDWVVGTLAMALVEGLDKIEVDEFARPKRFYGTLVHDNCPRRKYYDVGQFATKLSDPYCLYALGCKGPMTHADCPTRLWNSGTNWCIGCNSPCIGCTDPSYPDGTSPIYEKFSNANDVVTYVGLGLGGAAVAGIIAHAAGSAAAGRFSGEEKKGGKK